MSAYKEEYTGSGSLGLSDEELKQPPIEPMVGPEPEPRAATILVKAGTKAQDIQAVLDRAAQGDVIKFEKGRELQDESVRAGNPNRWDQIKHPRLHDQEHRDKEKLLPRPYG